MSSNVETAAGIARPHGWLRNETYDLTLILGVLAIALVSGYAVVLNPKLFIPILIADLWLLGYHHVIATFTRLSFDKASFSEHKFLVLGLPFIVFGGTLLAAWGIGAWIVTTTYLYWQWFHYTRQSWGISRVYERKSGGAVDDHPLFSQLCFYLVPLWGILYRSWQAPDTFLMVELRVIPMPEIVVDIVGLAALVSVLVWLWSRLQSWWAGHLSVPHTIYMASHFTVFVVGYWAIEDITFGWLVINVWHNAQYLLFVWLFNTNKFKDGVDPKARFLSTISQPKNKVRYFLCCFALSTLIYGFFRLFDSYDAILAVPVFVVLYQTINFHHYIVDSIIWKVRTKRIQKTLGLS